MWISRKEYDFLKENAEKNIDFETEILKIKEEQTRSIARAMQEYSKVLEENDHLKNKLNKHKRIMNKMYGSDKFRPCITCDNFDFDMPQCAECNSSNAFKHYRDSSTVNVHYKKASSGLNEPCMHCEHYGWDMPQCKECDVGNNFKYYKNSSTVSI